MDDVDTSFQVKLKVGLKYLSTGGLKATGTLMVDIKQAKDLPETDSDSMNPVVKLHLLPNRKSSGKRKTGVVKKNLNPVWEEKFAYKNVSSEELLRKRVLEVSMWSKDRSGNRFIGGLRLGPSPEGSCEKEQVEWMDSMGDEVNHWQDMLDYPGEWVEQWHTLRTTLKPRQSLDLYPET